MANKQIPSISQIVQVTNLQTKPGSLVTAGNNVILGKYNIINSPYNHVGGYWNNIGSPHNIVGGFQNTIPASSPNTHISGNSNIIAPGSNPAAIFGSNNSVQGYGSVILGSNLNATQSNSITTNLPIIFVDNNNNPSQVTTSLISITYSTALSNSTNNTLIPSQQYFITDRGDNGIILEASSTSEFGPMGIRLMLCPTYYGIGVIQGNTWLGVWNTSISVSVGGLAIWGGLVWSNLTGSVGSATNNYTLDNTNWSIIDKQTFSNNEYTTISFSIQYDFNNDWISWQIDTNNNIVGVRFNYSIGPKNPVDVTDWNIITFDIIDRFFYNNNCPEGIYNNIVDNGSTFGIYSNNCRYIVSNNNISINNNICQYISNNNFGDVIQYNIIPGYIDSNTLSGGIMNNTNNGSIYSNGTSTTSIVKNSNNGDIYSNTITNTLSLNSNNGDIFSNSGCDGIISNSNTGNISNNSCPGTISLNNNNGVIDSNSNSIDIFNNSNNGNINSNTTSGNISHNVNNGIISGITSGNVNDTIVNKT